MEKEKSSLSYDQVMELKVDYTQCSLLKAFGVTAQEMDEACETAKVACSKIAEEIDYEPRNFNAAVIKGIWETNIPLARKLLLIWFAGKRVVEAEITMGHKEGLLADLPPHLKVELKRLMDSLGL